MAPNRQEPSRDASPKARMPALDLALRLDLHLQRSSTSQRWSAELTSPEAHAGQPLRFASLPELIAFIARLDHPAGGGLR